MTIYCINLCVHNHMESILLEVLEMQLGRGQAISGQPFSPTSGATAPSSGLKAVQLLISMRLFHVQSVVCKLPNDKSFTKMQKKRQPTERRV